MIQQPWVNVNRKNIVCVDSYEEGVPKGRIYSPGQEAEGFSSLSQFLIRMETLLDGNQMPQSYTEHRTFSSLLLPEEETFVSSPVRKGSRATFELQVLFRQHTSWQGVLRWREQNVEYNFRSVLELVMLMDSALRSPEGSGVA